MTREEAKELLPVIQAYAEGKTIQFLRDDVWGDMTAPNFTNHANYYRIKPEPKYRPFKNKEECWQEMQKHQPFGWVVDRASNFFHLDSIYSFNPDGGYVVILSREETSKNCFEYILEELKFADGTPFGIKEE